MKRAHSLILFTILFVALLLLPFSVAVASEITLAADSTCAPLKKAGESLLAKGLQSSYITADYFVEVKRKKRSPALSFSSKMLW